MTAKIPRHTHPMRRATLLGSAVCTVLAAGAVFFYTHFHKNETLSHQAMSSYQTESNTGEIPIEDGIVRLKVPDETTWDDHTDAELEAIAKTPIVDPDDILEDVLVTESTVSLEREQEAWEHLLCEKALQESAQLAAAEAQQDIEKERKVLKTIVKKAETVDEHVTKVIDNLPGKDVAPEEPPIGSTLITDVAPIEHPADVSIEKESGAITKAFENTLITPKPIKPKVIEQPPEPEEVEVIRTSQDIRFTYTVNKTTIADVLGDVIGNRDGTTSNEEAKTLKEKLGATETIYVPVTERAYLDNRRLRRKVDTFNDSGNVTDLERVVFSSGVTSKEDMNDTQNWLEVDVASGKVLGLYQKGKKVETYSEKPGVKKDSIIKRYEVTVHISFSDGMGKVMDDLPQGKEVKIAGYTLKDPLEALIAWKVVNEEQPIQKTERTPEFNYTLGVPLVKGVKEQSEALGRLFLSHVGEKDLEKALNTLDTDGDKIISYDNLCQAIKAYAEN